jgi:hypothetical protein
MASMRYFAYMNPEVKLAQKGIAFVGTFVFIGLIILGKFFLDMADLSLAGASPKFAPKIPAASTTDITSAAQCNPAYGSKWVGCNRLGQ